MVTNIEMVDIVMPNVSFGNKKGRMVEFLRMRNCILRAFCFQYH